MTSYLYILLIVVIIYLTWLFYNMKLIVNFKGEDIFGLKIRISITIALMFLLISFYVFWNDILLHNRTSIMKDYWWLLIIGFVLHMLWPVLMVKNIYDLSVVIKKMEEDYQIERKCNIVIAILLSFYLIPGVVYLQIHYNKLRRKMAA